MRALFSTALGHTGSWLSVVSLFRNLNELRISQLIRTKMVLFFDSQILRWTSGESLCGARCASHRHQRGALLSGENAAWLSRGGAEERWGYLTPDVFGRLGTANLTARQCLRPYTQLLVSFFLISTSSPLSKTLDSLAPTCWGELHILCQLDMKCPLRNLHHWSLRFRFDSMRNGPRLLPEAVRESGR